MHQHFQWSLLELLLFLDLVRAGDVLVRSPSCTQGTGMGCGCFGWCWGGLHHPLERGRRRDPEALELCSNSQGSPIKPRQVERSVKRWGSSAESAALECV